MSPGARTIAAALEAEIREGGLLPGTRLPTHRELAFRHGVALNTASRAMRLLETRGLVVGEVGRGSFVRAPGHVDAASFRIEERAPGIIDLARNVMPLPGLADRFERAARLVLRRERAALADYQPHAGRAADRAAGAAWMARRGLPDDPARVVICAGAQHAVTVALMATTRPGDTIAVEALTWPGIRASAAALGLEVVPVPMDGEGLRPRVLLRLALRHRIAALYLMPSLQNPTGVTMPARRREAVAAIARRLDFRLIEDDAYGFLTEEDLPVPPLATLVPELAWYLRSTSKSFAPGLRAAWMLVPPGQEERAANLIRATVWTAPPLGAAIASLWVGDGTAALLEAAKRREARARQALAASLLPLRAAPSAHPASMHLWLDLPPAMSAQDMVQRVAAQGVSITPGAAFAVGSAPNGIRLALGAPVERAELERALCIIGRSLRAG
ncbi:PLP-dependent aminotransferase family protein [Roseomonas indoligenes]|uniref:PLP-dependent aminotransferase family protein n=1 Tax=Roseomonas indoligenes TaxID=2820811 RepID=A0A940N0U2_9PROT|nr:PLP-dependent aminotransferase family protein [Pararoseomonas indoligenes]MBP0495188.1 PLP-dependent aminotransferase family protein [Pararoseomonas indoligenes]